MQFPPKPERHAAHERIPRWWMERHMKAIECFSVSISGGYGRRLVIKGPVDSREHAAAPGFSKSAVRGGDILLEYGRGRLFSIFKCSIFRQPGNRHRWYRPCSYIAATLMSSLLRISHFARAQCSRQRRSTLHLWRCNSDLASISRGSMQPLPFVLL